MWLDQGKTARAISYNTINRICFLVNPMTPAKAFEYGFEASSNNQNQLLSFTTRFLPATLPLINEQADSNWIYIFYTKKGYRDKKANPELLYTDKIEPRYIIGAIKLSFGTKEKKILVRYITNPGCQLSRETKELAKWYVNKAKALNHQENCHHLAMLKAAASLEVSEAPALKK